MAAHRGHWTAGLRGLWCLGGKGLGAPGGTEGKGAWLRWIYYPPLAAITNEIQCAITYVRRDIPAKVLSVFASYHASLFHRVHTYPRILSSSSSSNRSTRLFFFFGIGGGIRIVELVTLRFFLSWRNIIVIIIVFGNIRLKYGIRNLKNFIDWKIFGYFSFRNSSSNSRLIVLRYCLVEVNNHERKSDFKIHRFSRVFHSCLSSTFSHQFWCCLTFHTLLQFFQENLSSKRKFWKSYSISKYNRMFLAFLSSFCFRETRHQFIISY